LSLSKLNNNKIGYYLAGLIEVDGSFIVPLKKSKITLTISISFNIIDKPLAICIKERLGYGFMEEILAFVPGPDGPGLKMWPHSLRRGHV